jgi:hypothetical protein
MTIIVFLLLCSNGIQAQNTSNDLDQLKLAEKYFAGTWQQVTSNDTVDAWQVKRDGNVLMETDYIIVNGQKTIYSYWIYNYAPKRDNFYMFVSYVYGGCLSGIGSFIDSTKWQQEIFEMFSPDKFIRKAEFVYDTPMSLTRTVFNSDGVKMREVKYSKVK